MYGAYFFQQVVVVNASYRSILIAGSAVDESSRDAT